MLGLEKNNLWFRCWLGLRLLLGVYLKLCICLWLRLCLDLWLSCRLKLWLRFGLHANLW